MARSRSKSKKRMSRSIMESSSSKRSRSRSIKEKTYSVTYDTDSWEPGYVYFVKAKSPREAENLVAEYYIRKVIEKYDDPEYTGGKLVRRMSDDDVIKKVMRQMDEFDQGFYEGKIARYKGYIDVDGMRFNYWGVTAIEVKPQGKVTPMFDEKYAF